MFAPNYHYSIFKQKKAILGVITVFNAISSGTQSDQKLVFVWRRMANNFF